MTDDKWQEVVTFISQQLEKEAEFEVDREDFYLSFRLTDTDGRDFIERRGHLKEKYFEYRREDRGSRCVLVFSRLGTGA